MFPEKPLTMQIAERFTSPRPSFGQTLPAVDQPLEPLPAQVSITSEIFRPVGAPPSIWQGLAAVRKALLDVEGQSPDRDMLLASFLELSGRIEGFFTARRAERRSFLDAELERLTVDCRGSLDRIRELRAEAGQLQATANALGSDLSRVRLSLTEARGSKPDDEDFPLPAELSAWQARVDSAQTAVDRAELVFREAQGRVYAKNAELAEESRRLRELRAQRVDVKAELANQPRRGAFGLTIPPQ
jgi:chromosome segregation ATPase